MYIKHLKLYHFPATRSARVKWMLHEVVGDAFEIERVLLYDGGQYSAEFMKVNPNHGVPVLQIHWDSGETLCMIESAAIVSFLADSYPNKSLAPAPQIALRLEQAPYICGHEFTAADCVVGHSVIWARGYGLCRAKPFRGYLSTLSKRPAFISAFSDAEQFLPEVQQDRHLAE